MACLPPVSLPAIRELRVSVVNNGFLVYPRESGYREGDMCGAWVFQTAQQLADWIAMQPWDLPAVERAGGPWLSDGPLPVQTVPVEG